MSLNEISSIPASLAERTLGDIAVALPGATAIFRASKLDYFCGGRKTLAEAAAAKSIEIGGIVADLERLGAATVAAPAQLDTKTLIETIVTRYHRVHSQELPELVRLAKRVESVHRDHPSAPAGLANLLEQIFGELTTHMQKEELILFPAMAKGGRANIGHPIAAMMADHDDHGLHLQALKDLTDDIHAPEGACTTWRALYAGLAKLSDDLVEHIHVENNILFPRFLGAGA